MSFLLGCTVLLLFGPKLQQVNRCLRAEGSLDDAEDMIGSMPMSLDMAGWKALITGCRAHGNNQLGKQCFDGLLEIDPNDAAGYMLMSNICAGSFALDEVQQIQVMRKFASAVKKPGTAWIEVDNQLHEFLVGMHSASFVWTKFQQVNRCLRAEGCLDEAEDMIASMPMSPDMVGWKALITGCRAHGNNQLGK
ncbi:hypothetical protein L7F22_008807 [Adiantum nelumboides]|nr:hypothetical protein [Adiantum nelumboides]